MFAILSLQTALQGEAKFSLSTRVWRPLCRSRYGTVCADERFGLAVVRSLSPPSATRLSLSFLRFCHGNAGENGVESRSWAKCLLENHHLHG